MAKSRGLAALVPNGVKFTKDFQSKVSSRLSNVLSGLSSAIGKTISINSGYRSPSYNKSVGGAKSSYHTRGLAADIDMTGWTDAERQQAVAALASMGVGGFITYTNSPNMLHIDMRPTTASGPLFMHDKTARRFDKAPQWMKEIAGTIKRNPIQALLPETMLAPQTLAHMVADPVGTVTRAALQGTISPEQAAEIAAAYSDPSRAQDVKAAVRETINAAYADPSRMADVVSTAPTLAETMPASMKAPMSLADTQMLQEQNALKNAVLTAPAGFTKPMMANEAIARAINPPAAQTTVATRPDVPVGRLPAAPTKAVRPELPAAGMPAAPAAPAQTTVASRPDVPVGGMPAAAPARTQPSRPVSQTPKEALAAMTREAQAAETRQASFARPELAAAGMPAAKLSADINPARLDAGMPASISKPSVQQQVSDAMHQVDKSVGKMAPGAPASATAGVDQALRDATAQKMAAQYGQYRTPTNYTNVRTAMTAPPAAKPAPVTTKPATPAPAAPTASVTPATPGDLGGIRMSNPKGLIDVSQEFAVAPFDLATINQNIALAAPPAAPPPSSVPSAAISSAAPPAAPAARAYDVYSGLATEAKDNTGQNTVTRDALGRTAVTNKYGVTTVTMPDGKQAATSAPFSGDINEALGADSGGLSKASLSKGKTKDTVKDIGSTIAGALLGGYFGGPLGAALGAKGLNAAVMGVKPTSLLGRALGLNSFPDRPGPSASGQRGFGSSAARDHAYSVSPRAAAEIEKSGGTGLY